MILPVTNRQARKISPSSVLLSKIKLFVKNELDVFCENNKENLTKMRNIDTLPLKHAVMPRKRFKMMYRFIRFDTTNTHEECIKTDRCIWIIISKHMSA